MIHYTTRGGRENRSSPPLPLFSVLFPSFLHLPRSSSSPAKRSTSSRRRKFDTPTISSSSFLFSNMEILIRTPVSSASVPPGPCHSLRSQIKWRGPAGEAHAFPRNISFSLRNMTLVRSSSTAYLQRCRSNLGSLFCYDKSIPEENIEKPVGLTLSEREIGDNPPCYDCQTKGAVLCATCSGSGLYVDSILESQGIIVKVRCLGCGGTGNIMCSECGGRGYL